MSNSTATKVHVGKQIFHKNCVSNDCNDCCCAPLPLDTSTFENGYNREQSITDGVKKLFCSNVREERVSCGQYGFCTEFHMKPTEYPLTPCSEQYIQGESVHS